MSWYIGSCCAALNWALELHPMACVSCVPVPGGGADDKGADESLVDWAARGRSRKYLVLKREDVGSLSCFCKDLFCRQVFHLGSVSHVGLWVECANGKNHAEPVTH